MNVRGGKTVPVIHVKVSNHDVGSGRNDQQEPTIVCPVAEESTRNHHNNPVDCHRVSILVQ